MAVVADGKSPLAPVDAVPPVAFTAEAGAAAPATAEDFDDDRAAAPEVLLWGGIGFGGVCVCCSGCCWWCRSCALPVALPLALFPDMLRLLLPRLRLLDDPLLAVAVVFVACDFTASTPFSGCLSSVFDDDGFDALAEEWYTTPCFEELVYDFFGSALLLLLPL